MSAIATKTKPKAKTTQPKPSHKVASPKEWLSARKKLLEAEKELTRRSDELAKQRQDLPWVKVDKDYRFETGKGTVSLADLFQGRSQLLIYHFMFGPDYTAGCPSCSSIADGFDAIAIHLANHDVTLGAVSRAPFKKLQAYQQRMGWHFPWASSFGSDFNFDFGVSFTEEQQFHQGIEYNYRREQPMPKPQTGRTSQDWKMRGEDGPVGEMASSTGTDVATYIRERPGMSAFIMENGAIYHTYSAYSRGLDALWSMYPWLDRAPLGRNETGIWWRRHDEYGQPAGKAESCCCQ